MIICNLYFILLFFLSVLNLILSLMFLIKEKIYLVEWEMLSVNSNSFLMTIYLDWMSLMFMGFVLFISSMIIKYSKEYMSQDLNLNRFIMIVLLFVLSMMLLIISPNLISILLGWDGLGLVSYCLVIYYQSFKSYSAGMLTALSNRIGDVALLMAIAWMLNYGSWNFVFYIDCMKNDIYMNYIGGLVILAAMTKSAQIPFSSWLPAAMAAPTPVSSLVHSSTLVTAGVYLLIRFHVLLSKNMMLFLLIISSLTMFMSGLGANFEFDLKKIIALSTLSQLGLMMSILAVGNYNLAFFHLLSHALFKALLFMCAGSIIHNFKDCQDIRLMGGLINFMPLSMICMNICSMSLGGLPFLVGFYSKDLILEFTSMSILNMFIYIIFYLSVGLTIMYSFRLFYYLIIKEFNFFSSYNINDESWVMLKGMLGLIFLVILSGNIMIWLMFSSPMMICVPFYMKILPLIIIMVGGWLGYEISSMYFVNSSLMYNMNKIMLFMFTMWFMPVISTIGLNKYPLIYGNFINKLFDYGWSEYYGGQGLFKLIMNNSKFLFMIFNNSMKIFLMFFLLFIIMLFYFM
uniref:NADH-ubiquinone oxidoreductase chain 5 n=1 Tax=Eucinetus haemorrhoidalis TaxID=1490181 RepID=A0A343A4B2_9COLE|nr:NADH dehydrogenase subunit 5 [Eucinetus haemorrhoidalis]AOY39390.1 NADH dehydrogenase subunit 5 [Eucinetus haemorrhoidalis]